MSETEIGGVKVGIRAPLNQLKRDFDQARRLARQFDADLTRMFGRQSPARARVAQQISQQATAARNAGRASVRASREAEAALKQEEAAARRVAEARAEISRNAAQADFNAVLGVGPTPGVSTAKESAEVFKQAFREQEDAAREAAQAVALQEQESAELQGRVDSLRSAIDPLHTAQRNYNAAIEEANSLLSVGAITQDEYSQAVQVAEVNLLAAQEHARRFTRNLNGMTAAGKLSSFQMTNLSFQLNDVVQGFALGQRPMQIFAQQGFQIAQVLGQGEGGIIGGIRGVLSLLTPLRLAIAGGAGAVVGSVAAWVSYQGALQDSSDALNTFGRESGLTQSQLESLARTSARTAGISRNAARELVQELIRAGRISEEAFVGIADISRDFAKEFKLNAKEAREELGSLFADPGKGARELAENTDLVTMAQARAIEALVRSNRERDAQLMLLDALSERLSSAEDRMTGFGRAASATGRSFSNLIDRAGEAIESFASASQARRQQVPTLSLLPDVGIGAAVRLFDMPEPEEISEAEARARQLRAEMDRLAAQALDIASQTEVAATNRRRQQLEAQIVDLEGDFRSVLTAEEQQRVATALDAKRRALETLITPTERSVQLARVELAIAREINPARRAELAVQRARIESAGEEITTQQALTRELLAFEGALAEIITPARQRVADMEFEAAAQERLNAAVRAGDMTLRDAQRALALELELRPHIVSAAVAEGEVRERLLRVVEKLTEAQERYNDAQDAASAITFTDQASRGLETQTANLRAQEQALGMTRREAIAYLEVQRRLNEAAQQQITLGPDQIQQIRQQADAFAQAQTSLDAATFLDQTSRSIESQIFMLQAQSGAFGITRRDATAYLKEQELINSALEQQIALTPENVAQIRQLAGAYADAQESVHRLAEATELARERAQFFHSGLSSGLNDLIFQGESFRGVLQGIVEQLAQAAIQSTLFGTGPLRGLFGGGSLLGGLFGVDAAGQVGGLIGGGGFHEGSPSVPENAQPRVVPARLFVNAPRLHNGLAPDEFPAILQRGEEVIPRDGRRRGGGDTFILQVSTPDMDSFKQNEAKITARFARSIEREKVRGT